MRPHSPSRLFVQTPRRLGFAGLIEISTVERGVVSLYGVTSELFVAMNTKGRLYGTAVFHEECKFKESLLPNNYNAYESSAYSGSYIALSKHGRVKKGSAMLLKSDGIGLVAIMGVKSERYLCMDANGKAFSSAVFNIEYCLFQHERLENGYDVYHSSKSNLVLSLGGRAHTYIPGGNLPPYSQFISLVNTVELEHFVRRRSTSIHVDPSDPFGMFTANSQPATEEDSVETQASREVPALSRERTRSTYHDEVDPDDPWRLLDHKTNSSPRYSIGSTFPIPSPLLNPTWGDPKRLVHLYTSSDKRSFHLAINRDGQVDRTPIQTPSSAMLLKSDGIGLVAIMGVKSERYLCMDANGKAFSSAVFNIEYCLFQHERLENGYDVYHSSKSNLVLSLGGRAHTYIPGGNLPPYSQFISLVNTVELEHFVRRRSTSVHVDPSDPFGMFTANSQPAMEEDSVETQASREVPALSRERTRSTYHDEVDPDDPWRLLDHKTNSSPRYSVS
ncbi:UNVERIFIED_CONTAM: hypothetical protein FKN15_042625 [Acipenser sinensis]